MYCAVDVLESTSANPLTLFWMCLFEATQGLGGGGRSKKAHHPKTCDTFPTTMKPGTVITYLKKIQKYMSHVTHHLSCADISIFSSEICKFCYIRKYRYRFHFGA